MTRINLIPKDRRQHKRTKRHLRFAVVGCGLYGLFLTVALTASGIVGAGDDRDVRDRLQTVVTAKLDTEKVVVSLTNELERTMNALHANLSVGNQPDWGVLLALLADLRGENVVLSRCATSSTEGTRGGGSDTGHRGRNDTRIDLQGLGRTQADVSQFVLRLDSIPLFRRVTLNDTRREPFLDGHATAFRIECDLETTKELAP